jgi:hypothetical protein
LVVVHFKVCSREIHFPIVVGKFISQS